MLKVFNLHVPMFNPTSISGLPWHADACYTIEAEPILVVLFDCLFSIHCAYINTLNILTPGIAYVLVSIAGLEDMNMQAGLHCFLCLLFVLNICTPICGACSNFEGCVVWGFHVVGLISWLCNLMCLVPGGCCGFSSFAFHMFALLIITYIYYSSHCVMHNSWCVIVTCFFVSLIASQSMALIMIFYK